MGNVLQAGEGQAPTRQALLGAGTTEMQKDIAKQLTNTHTHTHVKSLNSLQPFIGLISC